MLRGLGRVKGGVRAFPLAQSLVAPGSVEVFRSVRSIPPPCVPGDRDYLAPPFRQSASHLSSRPDAACIRIAHAEQFMRCCSTATLSMHRATIRLNPERAGLVKRTMRHGDFVGNRVDERI